MLVLKDLDALKAAQGQTIETATTFEMTQELVDTFAEATKDFQWIHTDPERAAKESPFGGAIAHGFFSLSLLPRFIEDSLKVDSVKMGVNYGLNKVRFPSPVPVGSKLSCRSVIKKVEDYPQGGVKVLLEAIVLREGSDKPVCVGEFLTLMFE